MMVTIKRHDGIEFNVIVRGALLSSEDIEFIRSCDIPVYWNNRSCCVWSFDERLPSGRFLENIGWSSDMRKVIADVY